MDDYQMDAFLKKLHSCAVHLESLVQVLPSTEDIRQRLKALHNSASLTNFNASECHHVADIVLTYFDIVLCGYNTAMPEPSMQSELLNCVYNLQSFLCDQLSKNFTTLFNNNECFAAVLLLTLKIAAVGDKLDVRFSLPMWKLFSNMLQQCKSELKRRYRHDQDFAFMEDVLGLILHSSEFYYDQCLQAGESPSTKTVTNSLKMLNLLCRIATFCAREFLASEMSKHPEGSSVALSAWLKWIISIRYSGGFAVSGTGLPNELARHLETSLFLSLDVLLDHFISMPPIPSMNLACSSAAVFLKHSDLDTVQRLRVYGIILSQLVKHPQCYPLWVGDDFNIYMEFVDCCKELGSTESHCTSSSTKSDALTSSVREFYTELLHQFCASVCGLPGECFFYLEQSLLSGILSEHNWTNMFCADAWCFLVRYGSGELCWQYALLLASSIQLIVASIAETNEKPNVHHAITRRLDRLGRLLGRFLIFLTPKQQVQFLNKYPLNYPLSSSSSASSALWRFVRFPIDRLQKSSRALASSQLDDRIRCLSRCMDSNASCQMSKIDLAVETNLTLNIADTLSTEWREQNATVLCQLTEFTLKLSSCFTTTTSFSLCAPYLKTSVCTPLEYLHGRLVYWLRPRESQTKSRCPLQLLRWLSTACSSCTESGSHCTPFRSFVVLRAWYFWLSNSEPNLLPHSGWLKAMRAQLDSVPQMQLSVFCIPLMECVRNHLTNLIENTSMAIDSPYSDQAPSNCISKFADAFTCLEQSLNANQNQLTHVQAKLLGDIYQRFKSLVDNLPSLSR